MRNRIIVSLLIVSMLMACSEMKYVPDDHYLLNKVTLKSDTVTNDIDIAFLKSYIRQQGNTRWFSAVKFPLAAYSLSGRDTTKWHNRFLRSIGEAPVLFDTVSARQSMRDLQQQLQNMGYLGATVDVMTLTKGKKLNAIYRLHPNSPYYIGHVKYEIHDSVINNMTELKDTTKRELHDGAKFNVTNLDNERKRITKILVNKGYYRFHKDFITYQADTTENEKDINLKLILHPFHTNQIKDTLHQQYRINRVAFRSGDDKDSTIHLRRRVLRNNTYIKEGALFSANDLQNTYQHFGRLQAIKYTNISFYEHPDTALLDCDIQLSTNKPSTISIQPEGTNTAGDLGAALSITYQNRNLFRGAENLSIELRGAFEAIKGLEGYSNDNFEEYSLETKLTFPRFIAPFLSNDFRRRTNATSEVALLYDLQNRPEFHRRVFSVAWRYKWNDSNHHDRYQFDLFDLNYVSMPWISETFRKEYLDDTQSRNAILRYNYEDLLIMKWGFGYIYNNGRYAIKTNIETAGNLLHLAAHSFHFKKNDDTQYKFFDLAYAQYIKGDFDITRNIQLDYTNQLVFHLGVGVAYPYGNSKILPFEKRYFSGGANSVRGWSVRSLGPGKYISRDGHIDFINQTGDVKLDVNAEYRTHLFWKLGGALFVDGGNIWTLRNYEDQPGGQFKINEFWKQMAFSYGLGFRLNFDYFILRFDMAMKAINPAYEESNKHSHYPIIYPHLSRDFAFHFAVGLPF